MSTSSQLNASRQGTGKPLLLIHGLGATWETWRPIMNDLSRSRDVIAIDLPGFGDSAPLEGEPSIAALTDSVEEFIRSEGLEGIDTVGSSMGARIVLELARRGIGGDTVALDPGGFWSEGERRIFSASLKASIPLILRLQPLLPALLGNPAGRTALLIQFSAAPWRLTKEFTVRELRAFAQATALKRTLSALVSGPLQEGAPAGTPPGRVTIGWGKQDRVTFPRQAARAQEKFPDARLHWFRRCGHFPVWDQPEETAQLILSRTG
ncbi:alpha/beta fold hydrolase [Hoyosella subflava]|uniref:Alpha/beta hydrolase fold protein n=1 Tax=Hoyosella subflava (strain DSM 45089 / JCM 17490 / NBRC 109087 / DQS3-9A1) TaxID=443218 RepID=F6EHK0_HOYSD|nr:alpha/beta hydrolase [Hoyosella subflava]AEF42364.1 Alpha/beta hydrolase fold protein [Hoyosella subflava DQS3-9A1]